MWADQQPVDSQPLPIAAEVFAGSLYGTDEASDDVSSIRSFLGLSLPIPRSEGWNKLFEQNIIDTDGFVKRQHRARVAKEDAALVRQASPFAKSPVSEVRQLYEARQLGAALLYAPVARLLGVY
ncbi:unnamed protein product [Effrenium voratum]|uniref:Uncharacterized protein n=1 Tax=Effrenium voratum TaxID=2562239 RepID=A0AA36ILJ9_9DINO|nr:unnamed protein product [Effrenium voratum]CAJ1422992.1 unnamed protein product [Effrenium voratum]